MIGRRAAAVVIAAALIVGAILIRAQLDGSDAADDTDRADATTLVCAAELRAVCQQIGELGVDVVTAEAGDTLDRLGAGDDTVGLWLTFAPFPEMAAIDVTTTTLAGSPIVLVADTGTTAAFTDACGDEPTIACVADLDLGVGFAASPDAATGVLGLTQAVAGYAPGGGVPAGDARFELWLRDLVASVPPSRLTSGTAIGTIQTRPSAMDVAVGPRTLLSPSQEDQFEITYATPMMRADVVLAVAPGVDVPAGLTDRLVTALTDAGWSRQGADGTIAEPTEAAAVRALWKELR